MKKFVLLAVCFGLASTSFAQQFLPNPIPPPNFYGGRFTVLPDGSILPTQPLVNTLQPIQQILDNLCGLGSSLGGIGGAEGKPLQFLCTARDITNYSVETIQNLNGDLANFSNRAAGSLANRVVGAFGEHANLGGANAFLNDLNMTLHSSVGQARRALNESIDAMAGQSAQNLFALNPNRALTDPENLGKVPRLVNTDAALEAINNERRKAEVLKLQGSSAIALNQASQNAAKLANNESALQLNQLVNTPVTGLAASLNARVGAAVSSREAMQRMTEGVADLMSVMATANSQVSANIASLAEQNIYTLQELSSLIEIESGKELQALEAAQHRAELEMLQAWDEVKLLETLTNTASSGLYSLAHTPREEW
jgi:hypothetical protein